MAICSRATIPSCVICGQLTMEPGVDEKPWAAEQCGDGYVCSEACELRDVLRTASPQEDWHRILDAAHRLGQDHADLTCVRVHRAACTPVEGVLIDVKLKGIRDVLLEDENGDEVCCLLGMVECVEVVEDA